MNSTEETELISRNSLFIIRKKKLQDEIQAAKRILKEDIDPLEIGDDFIHNIFKLMKDGIVQKYPELSEIETLQKMRDSLTLTRKIKKLRKSGRTLG